MLNVYTPIPYCLLYLGLTVMCYRVVFEDCEVANYLSFMSKTGFAGFAKY